jgi:PelA/Pel-15E family pectate lyase
LKRWWIIAAVLQAICCSNGLARAEAPSLAGFGDAIHHFQLKRDATYSRYSPDDVRSIAENLLLLQRDHGGWVQNRDPLQIQDEAGREKLLAEKSRPEGSFDNRNVYTQIAYLAAAAKQLDEPRYLVAASKGLEYLLRYQLSDCGGWPHSVPASAPYQAHLTVADEVFSGPLQLLRAIHEGEGPYSAFAPELRLAASQALQRGEACLLRLQVRQGKLLTGWAGQYDVKTLQPAGGRSFELPALVVQETVDIVRYLMRIPAPSPAVVASVEGATRWLATVKMSGWRQERVELGKTVEYPHHRAEFDYRLVKDSSAPPLWPRFVDLADNSIVLANRDGVRVRDYSLVDPERRTGYAWFGQWPRKLLDEDLSLWRARHHLTRPVD